MMEPLIKITDIEEDLKKEDLVSDLLLSSSEKFNFVLPDLGKVTLTENTEEKSEEDEGKISMSEQHKETGYEGNKSFIKKHSPSKTVFNLIYPYFTKFAPFNKSFYKPMNTKYNRNQNMPGKRKDQRTPARKPTNLLSNIVRNSLNLLNLGPKLSQPNRKHTKPFTYSYNIPSRTAGTANKFEHGPNIKQKFDFSPDTEEMFEYAPFTEGKLENRPNFEEKFDINNLPFLPASIPIDQMSQEFLLAHLVLLSIPLLFTGIMGIEFEDG